MALVAPCTVSINMWGSLAFLFILILPPLTPLVTLVHHPLGGSVVLDIVSTHVVPCLPHCQSPVQNVAARHFEHDLLL